MREVLNRKQPERKGKLCGRKQQKDCQQIFQQKYCFMKFCLCWEVPEALEDEDGYRADVYIASHLYRKLMNLGSRLIFGYNFRNILTAAQIPR